jgi:hypothetical protein
MGLEVVVLTGASRLVAYCTVAHTSNLASFFTVQVTATDVRDIKFIYMWGEECAGTIARGRRSVGAPDGGGGMHVQGEKVHSIFLVF